MTPNPGARGQPPATSLNRLWVFLAMGGGLGLAPKAPGTFGSLPGLALAWATAAGAQRLADDSSKLHAWLLTAAVLGIATLAAWVIIARAEAVLGHHDDQRIVIDEVVGQAIAAAFVPTTWPWYLAAFILFRALDVTKPGPIGHIDRRWSGAAGTLFDDVLAGVMAALILTSIAALQVWAA